MQAQQFLLHDQTWWLTTERCVYWENEQTLIVSDLHFGKTGHFRKSGIGVPQSVYREDLQRLMHLLQFYKPQRIVAVGDLFHSSENKELDFFKKWRNDFAQLEFVLVKGNHDILTNEWYKHANITLAENHLNIARFCFVHDIAEACADDETRYYFSGHIHPCITLRGSGKQSISLPCYYFGQQFAVLPAFSKFTGGVRIDAKSSDHVFAIIAANQSKGQQPAVVKV